MEYGPKETDEIGLGTTCLQLSFLRWNMMIRELFNRFHHRIKVVDLKGEASGFYFHEGDVIQIDRAMVREIPGNAKIVVIHEMMHSTGATSRLNRIPRLEKAFGKYVPGSKSYRVEECIAECATMAAMMKLKTLNKYTRGIIEKDLLENFDDDIYIPWREVTAAVKYYADETEDFSVELGFIRDYMRLIHGIAISDTYKVE